MRTETLPFRVVRVREPTELVQVARLRSQCYGRHLPTMETILAGAEPEDYLADVVVLAARAYTDDAVLGTVRFHLNSERPLPVEESVTLPESLRGLRLEEATRLAVLPGERLVKYALFKSLYLHALANGVDVVVAAGRDPVWRQYQWMLFDDLFPDVGPIALAHVDNVPHRVMAMRLDDGHQRWRAANHPLLGFFRDTHHPDIDVDSW